MATIEVNNKRAVDRNRRITGMRAKAAERQAALRSSSSAAFSKSGDVRVDADNGIVFGVSLMTIGPAKGHGFSIDGQTLDDIVELASAQPDGVRMRFGHPAMETSVNADGELVQVPEDDIGKVVGRVRNVRRDADRVRGDLYIGSYAAQLPGEGDVRTYLLDIAREDPSSIGMSAYFVFAPELTTNARGDVIGTVARVLDLMAFDVVGIPAANPNGLLRAKPTARMFDPQPPSGTPDSSGWSDEAPADPPAAPLPVETPDDDDDEGNLRLLMLRLAMDDGEHDPSEYQGADASSKDALDTLTQEGALTKDADGNLTITPRGMARVAKRWAQSEKALNQVGLMEA